MPLVVAGDPDPLHPDPGPNGVGYALVVVALALIVALVFAGDCLRGW